MDVTCPHCGRSWSPEQAQVGEETRCPACSQTFVIEEPSDAATPDVSEDKLELEEAPDKREEPESIPQEPSDAGRGVEVPVGTAPPTPSPPPGPERLDHDTIARLVRDGLIVLACAIGQALTFVLPGMDLKIGGSTLGGLVRIALAIAVLVLMIRLLRPLKAAATYYSALVARSSARIALHKELRDAVSSGGTYVVLLAYVTLLYQAVIRWLAPALLRRNSGLHRLVVLACGVVALAIVVKLVLALRPLFRRVTDATTDKAVELTEKADSRPCPACGTRATRSARFCPSCGVQMDDEASAT